MHDSFLQGMLTGGWFKKHSSCLLLLATFLLLFCRCIWRGSHIYIYVCNVYIANKIIVHVYVNIYIYTYTYIYIYSIQHTYFPFRPIHTYPKLYFYITNHYFVWLQKWTPGPPRCQRDKSADSCAQRSTHLKCWSRCPVSWEANIWIDGFATYSIIPKILPQSLIHIFIIHNAMILKIVTWHTTRPPFSQNTTRFQKSVSFNTENPQGTQSFGLSGLTRLQKNAGNHRCHGRFLREVYLSLLKKGVGRFLKKRPVGKIREGFYYIYLIYVSILFVFWSFLGRDLQKFAHQKNVCDWLSWWRLASGYDAPLCYRNVLLSWLVNRGPPRNAPPVTK